MPVIDVYSMGTSALACMGVRANGMTTGMIGAGLAPPPPVAMVPPTPPLGVVPMELDEKINFVYFAILYIVVCKFEFNC